MTSAAKSYVRSGQSQSLSLRGPKRDASPRSLVRPTTKTVKASRRSSSARSRLGLASDFAPTNCVWSRRRPWYYSSKIVVFYSSDGEPHLPPKMTRHTPNLIPTGESTHEIPKPWRPSDGRSAIESTHGLSEAKSFIGALCDASISADIGAQRWGVLPITCAASDEE